MVHPSAAFIAARGAKRLFRDPTNDLQKLKKNCAGVFRARPDFPTAWWDAGAHFDVAARPNDEPED
jgi:hypothetical protein